MMNSRKAIDVHIHHYPEEIADNPAAWARERGENHWADLMEANTLQGWPTLKRLLEDMEEAHVECAILQGWYWQNLATCIWHNEWQAQWISQHPDKLLAFASVQPLYGEKAIDALKKAHDDGLKGLGEVFPAAQGFPIDHPTWLKMVTWATENNMPITLHVPEPAGHHYAGKIAAPLSDYQWLAERFPETTFIFAHWGGLLPFYELNAQCKKALKNVYYDTAASPLLYDKQIYTCAAEIVGSKKVLFGSDYPLRTFPKKQTVASFKHAIQEIETAGLPSEETNDILLGNAQQLLNKLQT